VTKEEARKIVGRSCHGVFLRNMHKALSIHRWDNTAEEELRLKAACKLLRKKYVEVT